MRAEENRSLVRRYVEEVLNDGKLELLDDLVLPKYKRYLLPTASPLTAAAQKQRLAGFHAAFPDLHLTIEDLIADGDLVAVRMTLHGTHQGNFQGLAPTNKHVSVFAVDVVRIQDGRFREHWGGPDMLPLLQQLGATVSTDGPR
jgi:predicted ester cyclase